MAKYLSRQLWLLLFPLLSAVIVAAFLILLIFLLYYRMGGQSEANIPVIWNGSVLRLLDGQGGIKADFLEVQQAGKQGIIFRTKRHQTAASLYGTIYWDIAGLDSQRTVQVLWWRSDGQRRQAVQTVEVGDGNIDLQKEPEWKGYVLAIGLHIPGSISTPVTIKQLTLQPIVLTGHDWINQFWLEWTNREDWTQSFNNFNGGATVRPLWPPVLAVVVWVVLSGLLYIMWMLMSNRQLRLMAFLILFLMGWLVLDLRWQWDLNLRLQLAVERFSGKDEQARRLADLDGDLYSFLLEINQHLPKEPVHLFVVSNDPSRFQIGRTRYHLLPHNSFIWLWRPPQQDQVMAGDYILIFPPFDHYRFNRRHRLLKWEDGQLAVELVYRGSLGMLFQVRSD